ncbi:DUF262 domain-containing protein [Haladaptatus salinisoli]|uniref:DUF262 domain-containing protein n=1 Tax=Haladaptatus salinisoli TaxID=2884876 RepID=UPI001D0AFB21|nr:DUF262 domain-containing protein [Haladaptatus salinisoli]
MQTHSQDLESLFLDGLFDIPEYQRSYAWETSQLDDLIDDLRYLPKDRTHFFGNVILDKENESYTTESGRQLTVYRIVDGQQRLTTALILLDVLGEHDDSVHTALDEANLIQLPRDRPRLLPQGQDTEFFQDCILGSMNLEASTPSQTRLENARDHFETKIEELTDEVSPLQLASRLRYNFQLNVVEVDDDSEAASIFESINDRGKPLSSLEKTKSFLMYMQNRAGGGQALRDQINKRFGGIYRDLNVFENGHSRVTDFTEDSVQQFHWGLYNGFDSNEYFNNLDTLKKRLHEKYRAGEYDQTRSTIDNYTAGLREAATAFDSIFRPSQKSGRLQKRLLRLLTLGRLANILPVLLAAELRFGDNPNDLTEIVAACETLVFRMYAIDRRRSDTGQGKLIRLAHDIHTSSEYTVKMAIQRLESITRDYTDDDRFERALRSPDFYNSVASRDIRYLFFHYGQALEAEDRESVHQNLEQILSSEFQVEHVLAQALDETHIPPDLQGEYEDFVHRLGNLTVASRYWNSTYGAIPFDQKKRVSDVEDENRQTAYANSMLKVQKVLADIETFDREAIERRESEIVEFALKEWSLNADPRPFPVATELRDIYDAYNQGDVDEAEISPAELAVMRALLDKPGWALRSIHKKAASYEDSPIEWTDRWSNQRTSVQQILYELRREGLAYTKQKSWYPATGEE